MPSSSGIFSNICLFRLNSSSAPLRFSLNSSSQLIFFSFFGRYTKIFVPLLSQNLSNQSGIAKFPPPWKMIQRGRALIIDIWLSGGAGQRGRAFIVDMKRAAPTH